MTKEKLNILIEKYTNGTASSEEILLLEKIISSAEENVVRELDNDAEISKTQDRIFSAIKKNLKKQQYIRVYQIAASVLIFFGIISFIFFHTITNTSNTVVYNHSGDPQFITLPDSSKVILNTKSELSYSYKFNSSIREIFLKGEASFDVVSNKNSPFIVHTRDVSTKVIGTEFNIKEEDELITITVAEGLVRVLSKIDIVNLLPNQQIVFNSVSKELVTKEVIADHYNLWYKDEINLKNLSLSEVAEILENLYDTTIEFEKEQYRNIKMSISFNRKEDFAQILNRINFVNNVKFKKKDNVIIVQ